MAFIASHEKVGLHTVFSGVENDVVSGWVDHQVTVFGAYGAITTQDLLLLESGDLDFVLDGAAVAAGFVPRFFGGLFCCHTFSWTKPDACNTSTKEPTKE